MTERLTLLRSEYTDLATLGRLFIGSSFFGYTLEPTARADGVKIKGITAIPAGVYRIKAHRSLKFKDCVKILQVPGFSEILFHGGNSAKDTAGCVLIAKNRIDNKTIQGTLKQELFEIVKNFKNGHLEIINTKSWEE